jgi:hypothetical protein
MTDFWRNNMKLYKKSLFELLQSMEEAFNYINQKSNEYKFPDHNVIGIFEIIVNAFKAILDIEPITEININHCYKVEFHDCLEKILNNINENDIDNYNSNLLKINKIFQSIKMEAEKYKYRIAVYGQDAVFFDLVNSNVVDVFKFNPIEHSDKDFDYLVLLEEMNENFKSVIDQKKIFNFKAHINLNIGWEFYQYYYDYLDSDKEFEGLITGLSYFEKGISTKDLCKRFQNFAGPGQDLFYDYQVMKFVLDNQTNNKNLKYAIIGLSYYSFHYDMSLSTPKERTNYYYPIFGTFHNYQRAEIMKKFYENHYELGTEFLVKDYIRRYFELKKEPIQKQIHQIRNSKFNSSLLKKEQIANIKASAIKELTKNYPKTYKENIEILKEILKLANKHKIKPILLICPTSKIYFKNLNPKDEKEFLDLILDLKKIYKFQFIDLFKSPLFSESDFFNPSHLNFSGATKLSKLLNKSIEW